MTSFDEDIGDAVVADGERLKATAHGPRPDAAPTVVLLHEAAATAFEFD